MSDIVKMEKGEETTSTKKPPLHKEEHFSSTNKSVGPHMTGMREPLNWLVNILWRPKWNGEGQLAQRPQMDLQQKRLRREMNTCLENEHEEITRKLLIGGVTLVPGGLRALPLVIWPDTSGG